MAQSQDSGRHIIIAGDAPQRLFLYPSDATSNSDSYIQRPQAHWFRVGSELLAEYLDEGFKNVQPRVHIHKPDPGSLKQDTIHSIMELDALPRPLNDARSFKLRRIQQVDMERQWHFPSPSLSAFDPSNQSFLLLQETKTEKSIPNESAERAISLFQQCRPIFVIYHMARYLCRGRVWEHVKRGPFSDPDGPDPERLIVVVEAEDLRAEGIELSYGLSWEKTCEDFVERLGSVGKLVSLATCAHLVVLLGCAGAIYHRGAAVSSPQLFFDPLSVEGEFLRKNLEHIPGIADAFVAGFTKGLVQSRDRSIADGIEFGLHAARRLAAAGLVEPNKDAPSLATVYRAQLVMRAIEEKEKNELASCTIPSTDIVSGTSEDWSLLDDTIGDPAEVARKILREGPFSPGSQVPLAQFNQLFLFDRHEIESFRTISNFLREYLRSPMPRPLCIALFGPRGSGKAFAALQVAEAASKGHKVRTLQIDLSQFNSASDLLTAFHSVRDLSLSGFMPLVYISGFDHSFAGSPLGWLPHLLPVMFNGFFSDNGVSRPVGAAVFFFGATSTRTYDEFRRRAGGGSNAGSNTGPKTGLDRVATNQAQEFLACLHGFGNLLGPDKAQRGNGTDRLYSVRRAAILRTLLERREPNLVSQNEIHIDDSVLNALLLVPMYRQGIRSLKSIIDMSMLNGRYNFARSSLPPPVQLDLHVDYKMFRNYLNGMPLPEQLREELAEKLHNVYRDHMARTPGKVAESWGELREELRESSRAHADSIPWKLREIKCFLSEKQEGRRAISNFSQAQIDRLGEIEHDRWNAERLQNRWGLGKERDVEERKNPFLKPWSDLEPHVREIDCVMVASYPGILPKEYKIYEFGPRNTKTQ
ncbi:hypothetical protein AYO21_10460 [Fonsecaea monophora]|uniref:Ryanodine receptor Ryr domain-containing protein n=1 Tax=Fonsecaea monophora TaxID=254056 RepID=A0A177EWR3_9EURO|nr:hypothetical protein AYO21_10460 [Fonsecaea monophora]KAH0846597.1 RyR domain protein [Fonsecaea pedrosoi]OAG35389.1 hypothetical protein AYO21_10460 [Fonsecaea monophora]